MRARWIREAMLVVALVAAGSAVEAATAVVANVPWGVYLLKDGDYNSKILGTVKKGETVEVLDATSVERYVKVRAKSQTGWIGRKYLDLKADEPAPELVIAPPRQADSEPTGGQDEDPFGELNRTGDEQGGTAPQVTAPVRQPARQTPRARFQESAIQASYEMVDSGARFDDFGDDATDNDGDWQRTDREAERDRKDVDRLSDDTGGDGQPNTGDTRRVTKRDIFYYRYSNKKVVGGEGDGIPTPGEPDLDGNDPDERNLFDGTHLAWRNDGKDNNDNGQIDEPEETWLVCIDLPNMTYAKAGYDLPKLMAEDARKNPKRYGARAGSAMNTASDPYLARRVPNVIRFLASDPRFYYFPEPNLRTVDARPRTQFLPGDVIFFGHTDELGTSKFGPNHSGIVTEIDPETGMPTQVVSMRTSGAKEEYVDQDFLSQFVILGHARPKF